MQDKDGHVSKWPGDKRLYAEGKVPSVLEYYGTEFRWGAMVKGCNEQCPSLFKLKLEENLDQTKFPYSILNSIASNGVFYLPDGKQARDVIQDYLKGLWSYAENEVSKETRQRLSKLPNSNQVPVHYIITVPDFLSLIHI